MNMEEHLVGRGRTLTPEMRERATLNKVEAFNLAQARKEHNMAPLQFRPTNPSITPG